MANRLKDQSSPYLLQHAENPVDWYPWGEEAFEKAEREDKPVFLSVGYSTCHWCHVMAHESFEDEETAALLNRYFVCVKVDREERPDIDSVYMTVCQALTGGGGWPMSIFMTAQQKPFYAGTYFPPDSHSGMIGFRDLLRAIAEQWQTNKTALIESAEQILSHVGAEDATKSSLIDRELLKRAASLFSQSFDSRYGGFGTAPKFPTPHNLLFLLLYSTMEADKEEASFSRSAVHKTLEQMRRGGIFDQIGFGFSRYSTDNYFLAPHFEKMLYDNALLILAYASMFKVSGEPFFLDTAEKTAAYVFREMTGEAGEFYSAQDADSEGEEGRFYLWNYEEICTLLGEETGASFCEYYGITERGNFEGKNIPNLLGGAAIADSFDRERQMLYEYRKSRYKLHIDDKILTSWNALMICAMVILYRATGKQRYLQAAERTQKFIEENLAEGDLLFVSCRNGARSVNGFLDDYAYYMAALIFLYEATAKPYYRERAKTLYHQVKKQFSDTNGGGFFLYGRENGSLITRPKETYDGAMPSGNSVMAFCLVRLSQILGEEEIKKDAEWQLAYMSTAAQQYPAGYAMFLIALILYYHPPMKITVVLSHDDSKEEILSHLPLCSEVNILPRPTEDYRLLNGKTTYYICHNHVCLPPDNSPPH